MGWQRGGEVPACAGVTGVGLGGGVEAGDVGLGLDEAVEEATHGLAVAGDLGFDGLHPRLVRSALVGRLGAYGLYPPVRLG